jgi:rhodanese-related sulfurtransferase
MTTITPAELQQLLAAQPGTTVLDVRTPVEFYEVHVAQARNLPLDQLRPAIFGSGEVRKDKPIYLLCRSGARAQKAAEKLLHYGFENPVVVEDGTQAWIDAALPVVRGTAKVISLERQVRIVAGSLVVIGVLLGWLVNRGFFGLAAFVGAGLVFAGISDFCGMGLLLAKLPWNQRVPHQKA